MSTRPNPPAQQTQPPVAAPAAAPKASILVSCIASRRTLLASLHSFMTLVAYPQLRGRVKNCAKLPNLRRFSGIAARLNGSVSYSVTAGDHKPDRRLRD